MRALSHWLIAVLVGSTLMSSAVAAGPLLPTRGTAQVEVVRIKWQTSLQKAAELAQKSGKPILVQFTAEWCTFCHKMLDETLSNQKIAKQINECFIPVVLDADANEQIVAALGVEAFPTTVVISSDLKSANRMVGFFQPAQFESQLAPFCKETRAKLAKAAAKKKPVKAEPQLAFEGLCLVSLLDDRKQIKGEERITAVYNDVRLRFSSEANRRAFLTDPEQYWPMNDGHCPVAKQNGEKDTTGDPATVAVYRGRLMMFSSMEHRKTFAEDPRSFVKPEIAAGDQPRTF